jgi:hypothetical protein
MTDPYKFGEIPWSYIGYGYNRTTASGISSGAFDTTGATLMVVLCSAMSQSFSSASISDTASNTWNPVAETSNSSYGGMYLKAYYCNLPTTNASHVVTVSGSTSCVRGITTYAFSGDRVSTSHLGPNSQENDSSTDTISIDSLGHASLKYINFVIGVANSPGTTVNFSGDWSQNTQGYDYFLNTSWFLPTSATGTVTVDSSVNDYLVGLNVGFAH